MQSPSPARRPTSGPKERAKTHAPNKPCAPLALSPLRVTAERATRADAANGLPRRTELQSIQKVLNPITVCFWVDDLLRSRLAGGVCLPDMRMGSVAGRRNRRNTSFLAPLARDIGLPKDVGLIPRCSESDKRGIQPYIFLDCFWFGK